MGFANFYRRFIKNYSKVVILLIDLLRGLDQKKNQAPLQLNSTAMEAFAKLKTCFCIAPILRYYEHSNRTMIETNASKRVIGRILSQLFEEEIGAEWHLIAFYSRKLKLEEMRYDIHNVELLAIIHAFKQWSHYL